MLVFSNVLVETSFWEVVGRNGCDMGLVRVYWSHAGGSIQIRETLC